MVVVYKNFIMYFETHSIKLSHTDAAGVIFYGRIYELAQEVVENYLNQIGFGVGSMLREKEYITPVVHSEADYFLPMRVGDDITIEIGIEKVGKSSFTTYYLFFNVQKNLLAKAKTVNVSINKKTGKTIPLPEDFKNVLIKGWEKSKITHPSIHE